VVELTKEGKYNFLRPCSVWWGLNWIDMDKSKSAQMPSKPWINGTSPENIWGLARKNL
jgi:hypothetical protein